MSEIIFCNEIRVAINFSKKVLNGKSSKKIDRYFSTLFINNPEKTIFYPLDFEYLAPSEKAKAYYYLIKESQKKNFIFITDNFSVYENLKISFNQKYQLIIFERNRLKMIDESNNTKERTIEYFSILVS